MAHKIDYDWSRVFNVVITSCFLDAFLHFYKRVCLSVRLYRVFHANRAFPNRFFSGNILKRDILKICPCSIVAPILLLIVLKFQTGLKKDIAMVLTYVEISPISQLTKSGKYRVIFKKVLFGNFSII